MRLLALLFTLFFFVSIGYGQSKVKKNSAATDTLVVKGKSFLVLPDTTIYVKNDSVLQLPDSIVSKIRKDREGRNEELYEKIKEKLSKRWITKEIYNLLFSDPTPQNQIKATPVLTDDFDRYTGKRINNIKIKRLDPFGTRITDTTLAPQDVWSKAGNKAHIKTRGFVIKSNLLIKEGDEVDGEILRDTERYLRQLRFLRDARVYIVPKSNTDEVDILVVTRDVWNITGSASYQNSESFEISLNDVNFLGLGYELRNEFSYTSEGLPNVGYVGTYVVNNIRKSFVNAEIQLARSYQFDAKGINVFRDFITPETKYAGGVEVAQNRVLQSRVYTDTTIMFDVKRSFQDYWAGRSFLIREAENGSRTNLQIAASYHVNNFIERPFTARDTNQMFVDNYLKLFSLGLAQNLFDRSSLIRGFGRTEDIPIGYLIELTIGRENNTYINRTYFDTQLSYGRYFDRLGYFRPTIAFGSFVNSKNFEQGVVKFRLDYFSFLYRIRRSSFRQFFSLEYTTEINRIDNEYININDNNGIRGLSDVFLRGTKKLVLQSETVAFTPIYFIGFRMAAFGFIDLAYINDKSSALLSNKLYQGYGVGLRFRNENLAFNTIRIRFGYYPNVPAGVSATDFNLSGQESLNLNGFRVDVPSVLVFE